MGSAVHSPSLRLKKNTDTYKVFGYALCENRVFWILRALQVCCFDARQSKKRKISFFSHSCFPITTFHCPGQHSGAEMVEPVLCRFTLIAGACDNAFGKPWRNFFISSLVASFNFVYSSPSTSSQITFLFCKKSFLKNASHRLEMPKAADITNARALATRSGKHLKLNISYGYELINWEISVHFDKIGLVPLLNYREDRF